MLIRRLCLLPFLLITAPVLAEPEPCPDQFHTIPLPDTARYCRAFNGELPASLSFHMPVSTEQAVAYYQQSFKLLRRQPQKARILLTSPEHPWRLVLSEDGQGTQVDILIPARES